MLLSNLPSDILEEILSLLTCERALLGACSKLNREFRNIALRHRVRKAVQHNVIKYHEVTCTQCVAAVARGVVADDVFDAIKRNRFNCVYYLVCVTEGRHTRDVDKHLRNVLHVSSRHGALTAIRYFLEEYVDDADLLLRQQDEGGATVMHWAIYEGHLPIVRYYLEERGATFLMDITDVHGNIPFHWAASGGQIEVLRYFIEERGEEHLLRKTAVGGSTVLHMAADEGQLSTIKYFVDEKGTSDLVHAVNELGNTVLHVAAIGGQLDILRYFVEEKGQGTMARSGNQDGLTPMMLAMTLYGEESEVAQYLSEVERNSE